MITHNSQGTHKSKDCWFKDVCLDNDMPNPPYCNDCKEE